jgi:hypothetical protein
MKGRGFARRVTAETLSQFAPLLRKPSHDREGTASARDSEIANLDESAAERLRDALSHFQGEPVNVQRPRSGHTGGSAGPVSSPAARPFTIAQVLPGERNLLWRKTLAASDVQSQRGNATGGVRLTQARFEVDGRRIDQTTYFRKQVFGRLEWTRGRTRPYREDAWADFHIILRGADLGVHRLRISHKPSGEAGQGNYTTILHWGALSESIRHAGLSGAEFMLVAPGGVGDPFSIEIV